MLMDGEAETKAETVRESVNVTLLVIGAERLYEKVSLSLADAVCVGVADAATDAVRESLNDMDAVEVSCDDLVVDSDGVCVYVAVNAAVVDIVPDRVDVRVSGTVHEELRESE